MSFGAFVFRDILRDLLAMKQEINRRPGIDQAK